MTVSCMPGFVLYLIRFALKINGGEGVRKNVILHDMGVGEFESGKNQFCMSKGVWGLNKQKFPTKSGCFVSLSF